MLTRGTDRSTILSVPIVAVRLPDPFSVDGLAANRDSAVARSAETYPCADDLRIVAVEREAADHVARLFAARPNSAAGAG
jgi:hypothetical protein